MSVTIQLQASLLRINSNTMNFTKLQPFTKPERMNHHDVDAEEGDEDESGPVQQRDAILQQTCRVANIDKPGNILIFRTMKVSYCRYFLQNISPM